MVLMLLKSFEEINPNVKIIFSSGYSENNEISELRKGVNVGFIQKPFKSATLLETIAELEKV